ncbi:MULTISPECIES: MarR family transcriptional regulator [unclassified Mycobacterium]|uniref:MarR family winged helix-turn-helix transcriptional regulator n=1 Tax=unclassified Mycobacterium TaxID=2642494 RepID=UPI0029C77A65|nr:MULTISPECIES: MarR family transcriptional regulator [unclassified Mycobacterium]
MTITNEFEEESLAYLLHQVAAMLRPQVAADLAPLGIGLPEFVCLRILAQHPGRTSADLARATHVSAQATNQVLLRLEAIDAVERRATAPVGRALPAQLTPQGKKLLEQAQRAANAADGRVLAGLTTTERKHLKALVGKAGQVS